MQETGETLSDDEIRDALTVKLETQGASLSGIAAEIGVNKGVLRRERRKSMGKSSRLKKMRRELQEERPLNIPMAKETKEISAPTKTLMTSEGLSKLINSIHVDAYLLMTIYLKDDRGQSHKLEYLGQGGLSEEAEDIENEEVGFIPYETVESFAANYPDTNWTLEKIVLSVEFESDLA